MEARVDPHARQPPPPPTVTTSSSPCAVGSIIRPDGASQICLLRKFADPVASSICLLGDGLWPAAFALGDELQQTKWRTLLASATVLELGAGSMGYPGMVSAICGGPSTRVTLTDKYPLLLRQLQIGVDDNLLASQCSVQLCEWRHDPANPSTLDAMHHDFIIASDVLYNTATTEAFCDALERLAGPRTHVLIACQERWSRLECIEQAGERGWHFEQLGSARHPSAEQLACVDPRELDMCREGFHSFVYSVLHRHGAQNGPPAAPAAQLQHELGLCLSERLERLQMRFPWVGAPRLRQHMREARGNLNEATEAILAARAHNVP